MPSDPTSIPYTRLAVDGNFGTCAASEGVTLLPPPPPPATISVLTVGAAAAVGAGATAGDGAVTMMAAKFCSSCNSANSAIRLSVLAAASVAAAVPAMADSWAAGADDPAVA